LLRLRSRLRAKGIGWSWLMSNGWSRLVRSRCIGVILVLENVERQGGWGGRNGDYLQEFRR
jgi:hypothetical protein